MTNPSGDQLLHRVRNAIAQDARKVSILVVLLLALGFLIVRQVLNANDTASAATAVDYRSEKSLFPASTGEDAKGRGSERVQLQSPTWKWLETPVLPVKRDVFAVKLDLFPPEHARSGETEGSGGFWDEIAKSLLDRADQQERKQEQLSELQRRATALQLTSVLMGPRPRAVINGELVGEGDVVAGFRVLQIEPRSIVVEREGIRLQITMN